MKEVLVNNFLALAAIPRPTFHEEAVGRYLCERAAARGLSARRDAVGNVIVDRPAAPGLEELPRNDLRLRNLHLSQYDGPANDLGNAVNDTYIKVTGQPDGVRSYGKVADLLIAYFLTE